MLAYLISGIGFGLAAGLSPGPLLAFLVSQTLRYGVREGLRVAIAPVLTDAPIVAAALLALSQLTGNAAALGAVSVAGGAYVAWLGIESLRPPALAAKARAEPRSIRKAMAINLLNPHVYLFWATVGAPTVLRAYGVRPAAAFGFVAGFYLLLCGSKAAIALLVHRSRRFLEGAAYRRTVQALGWLLIAFAAWLVWDGVALLRS